MLDDVSEDGGRELESTVVLENFDGSSSDEKDGGLDVGEDG